MRRNRLESPLHSFASNVIFYGAFVGVALVMLAVLTIALAGGR